MEVVLLIAAADRLPSAWPSVRIESWSPNRDRSSSEVISSERCSASVLLNVSMIRTSSTPENKCSLPTSGVR